MSFTFTCDARSLPPSYGICRSWRSLIIYICIVPLIHALIIMGGSTIHPSWDRSGCRMVYLSSFQLVASTGNLSGQ